MKIKLCLKLLSIISFFFHGVKCYSIEKPDYLWLEYGFGIPYSNLIDHLYSRNISLNLGYENFIARVDLRRNSIMLDRFGERYYDRETKEAIEEEIEEINILFGYSIIKNWARFNASLGGGYLQSDLKDNCSLEKTEGFGFGREDTYLCNYRNQGSISLSINFSAIVGKYSGIGIEGNASISEHGSIYSIGVIIPFGKFN